MSDDVVIFGYGRRGRRWTENALAAGKMVRLFDPDWAHGDPKEGVALIPRISEAVANVELVVLCIPHRLALIRKVLQRIQEMASPDTVVLVDTADIELDDLQGCVRKPDAIFRIRKNADGGVGLDSSAKNSPRALDLANSALCGIVRQKLHA